MRPRPHDPDATIGWLLLVVTMATVLLLMVWMTGCTHIADCQPVETPDEVLLPIPTPCEKLPVVEIPDREAEEWEDTLLLECLARHPLDIIAMVRECVAPYLSAVARDYLALYDTAVYLRFVIDSHNHTCTSADTGHTVTNPRSLDVATED